MLRRGLTFDDLLLVPNYNGLDSRAAVSTEVVFGPWTFKTPIISANMDMITGPVMARKMWELGCLGILHRFMTIEKNVEAYKTAAEPLYFGHTARGYLVPSTMVIPTIGVSVGVNEGLERAEALYDAGAKLFCVDVAHGHSKLTGKMVKSLREKFNDIFIIAGNVACMEPNSPVLTRDLRWVPVGTLKVGDRLMGFEETPFNGQRRRWKESVITYSKIQVAPLFKVTLDSGETFKVTGEHKWLVYDGHRQNRVWLSTNWMLRHFRADRFKVAQLVKPWNLLERNFTTGYLAGAFDGEGCLIVRPRNFSLTFTQKRNPMLESVCRALDDLKFEYYVGKKKQYTSAANDCYYLEIRGGFSENLRAMAQIRPLRLMEKWHNSDINNLTTKVTNADCRVPIVDIRPCGRGEIAAISTSSETYISAGYGMHNTYAGADYLSGCGADAIKVGIGPGSVCTTRVKTGFGVPQITAIMDCSRISKPIIADGGIRCPGDVVKALAAGARMVMLGGLLAGTEETPGEEIWDGPFRYKKFRGMASAEAHEAYFGALPEWKTAEGISIKVPCSGPVETVIKDITGGLRSGLTYAGATTVSELQQRAEFVEVSHASYLEGLPHAKGK